MTAEDKISDDKGKTIAEEFIRQFVNPNFKISQIPSDELQKMEEKMSENLEAFDKLLATGIVDKLLDM